MWLASSTFEKLFSAALAAATKAEAVCRTVYGEIGAHCPATALRLCPHASLYVDGDSGARLTGFRRGGSAR